MKKYVLVSLILLIATSCGISKKIKVLEKCTYNIKSVDNISLVGQDLNKLFKNKTFDLSSAPGLALAIFRKNVPLKANINLSVYNPTHKSASINQFDYIILIKGQEIANGTVNKKLNLLAVDTTIIPIEFNTNIYSFLSKKETMRELVDFFSGTNNKKKSNITIKIKPSFMLGREVIKYPAYINISKEISPDILF